LSVDQLIPEQQLQQWKSKALHGKYRTLLESDKIDTFASTAYLRSGNLFAETEGFISAIQDQVIATKGYKRNIMRERQDNIRCRVCGEKDEYLDHIIAGCSMLAPKSYLDRHNRVGKIIHQSLREKLADQNFSLSVDQLMPEQQLQQWKSKALHGKYRTLLENDNIDTFASTAYLRSGNLFAETEGFISPIQDQVIATKVYKET
ncbi:unnamed protein product, partial [Acanthoscelides obtectus]